MTAVRVDSTSLESYCAEHFRELGGQPLFSDADCRSCISDTLQELFSRWSGGVSPMLEGESRQQFDPDGFRRVLESSVIGPADLTADVQSRLDSTTSAMKLHRASSAMDDIFIVSILLDVHPDAVASLAEHEKR